MSGRTEVSVPGLRWLACRHGEQPHRVHSSAAKKPRQLFPELLVFSTVGHLGGFGKAVPCQGFLMGPDYSEWQATPPAVPLLGT